MSELPDAPEPKRRMFRSSNSPRLAADDAKRQGMITHLAFAQLGGREPALAFLNAVDPALGARPLDLAMASPEGYAQVAHAIGLLGAHTNPENPS